jgi:hypothetical protein
MLFFRVVLNMPRSIWRMSHASLSTSTRVWTSSAGKIDVVCFLLWSIWRVSTMWLSGAKVFEATMACELWQQVKLSLPPLSLSIIEEICASFVPSRLYEHQKHFRGRLYIWMECFSPFTILTRDGRASPFCVHTFQIILMNLLYTFFIRVVLYNRHAYMCAETIGGGHYWTRYRSEWCGSISTPFF